LLLCNLAASLSLAQVAATPMDDSLPTEYLLAVERRGEQEDNKIDSRLWKEYYGVPDSQDARPKGFSNGKPEKIDAPLHVTIRLLDENLSAALTNYLTRIGGNVEAVSGWWVFATLPRSSIPQLARAPNLLSVKPESLSQPRQYSSAISTVNLKDLVRAEGSIARTASGQGVRIGVLDCGFQDFDRLPQNVRVIARRSFLREGAASECGGDKQHGTRVVQIISEIAPGAEFVIAEFDGYDSSFAAGTKWLATQNPKPSIINYSGGKHEGPHDGTDVLDDIVRREAIRRGIVWVNSAGNEADKHVLLTSKDFEIRDGFLRLTHAPDSQGIRIHPNSSKEIKIIVTWTPWPAPGTSFVPQDLDWILFREDQSARSKSPSPTKEFCRDSANEKCVWFSANSQSGSQDPVESRSIPVDGNHAYLLMLRAVNVSRPELLRIHIFFLDLEGTIEGGETAEESLAIPATSRQVVAVGAVAPDTNKLRPYSSVGPAKAKNRKPEVAAYDGIAVEDHPPLLGTSFSSAIVAARAARLKQFCDSQNGPFPTDLYETVLAAGIGPNRIIGFVEPNQRASGCVMVRSMPEVMISSNRVAELQRAWNADLEPSAIAAFSVAPPNAKYYFEVGETMRISIQTTRDVYYALLNLDTMGKFHKLAPLGGESLIWKKGESPTSIPFKESERIVVQGPPGTARLVLILSDIPLDNVWQLGDFKSLAGKVSVPELGYGVR
jgi:hypothetical protein